MPGTRPKGLEPAWPVWTSERVGLLRQRSAAGTSGVIATDASRSNGHARRSIVRSSTGCCMTYAAANRASLSASIARASARSMLSLQASSYIARLFHCSAEKCVVSIPGSTGSAASITGSFRVSRRAYLTRRAFAATQASPSQRREHLLEELLEARLTFARPIDHEVVDAAGGHPLVRRLDLVPRLGDRQARRAKDRSGVAAGFLGRAVDDRGDLCELGSVVGPAVPRVRVAAGDRKRPLPALSPDPDRRMRLLDGQRPVCRLLELVVLAFEDEVLFSEERAEDLDAFLEAVHPLLGRRERDAELAMFRLVPRRADRALDAPAGEVIDRDDLRCQHGGGAMRHPGGERPEPNAGSLTSETRQQRPTLERRALRVSVERLEVVEDPDAVEAGVLGEASARDDLVPGQLVLRDVETDPH